MKLETVLHDTIKDLSGRELSPNFLLPKYVSKFALHVRGLRSNATLELGMIWVGETVSTIF